MVENDKIGICLYILNKLKIYKINVLWGVYVDLYILLLCVYFIYIVWYMWYICLIINYMCMYY